MLVKQCVCWEFVRKSIIVIEPQGCRCFYKTFLVSNNNLILYNILVVDTWEYWLTNVWYGNSKLSSEYLCILICIKNRNINKLFDTIKKKSIYSKFTCKIRRFRVCLYNFPDDQSFRMACFVFIYNIHKKLKYHFSFTAPSHHKNALETTSYRCNSHHHHNHRDKDADPPKTEALLEFSSSRIIRYHHKIRSGFFKSIFLNIKITNEHISKAIIAYNLFIYIFSNNPKTCRVINFPNSVLTHEKMSPCFFNTIPIFMILNRCVSHFLWTW